MDWPATSGTANFATDFECVYPKWDALFKAKAS
jgi:hypothetical protein